jgi:hypothetical protein
LGRRVRIDPGILFLSGVLLLPLSPGIRFLPLSITSTVGEMIPLTAAAPLSVLVMAPAGLISGLLFPVIAREGRDSGRAVASVYLSEGLGAFVAGLVGLALIKIGVGNLGQSLVIGCLVSLLSALQPSRFRFASYAACGAMVFLLATTALGDHLDLLCDQQKYPGYLVEQSLTHPMAIDDSYPTAPSFS